MKQLEIHPALDYIWSVEGSRCRRTESPPRWLKSRCFSDEHCDPSVLSTLQRALNAAQDTDIRNQLNQIALAYNNYWATNERGPNSQQELSPFYENNSSINDAITKKRITVIWE